MLEVFVLDHIRKFVLVFNNGVSGGSFFYAAYSFFVNISVI